MPAQKTLCTEICAHAICRKFGGRTFLRQFFSKADVKKCRVNTGEKHGGPGRVRTDDLFHAMEARSQLRHRPTESNHDPAQKSGSDCSILAYCVSLVKRGR